MKVPGHHDGNNPSGDALKDSNDKMILSASHNFDILGFIKLCARTISPAPKNVKLRYSDRKKSKLILIYDRGRGQTGRTEALTTSHHPFISHLSVMKPAPERQVTGLKNRLPDRQVQACFL